MMSLPYYAIGASALTGGVEGALDYEFYSDIENKKHVAVVFVEGTGIYVYVGNETSGAFDDGLNVIKPVYQSEGVLYTGDFRWILHQFLGTSAANISVTPSGSITTENVQAALEELDGNISSSGITSSPQSGEYQVTGIRLDSNKKIVITYNETPES